MKDIYQLFLLALKNEVDKKGRGIQAKLARAIGITPKHINDILGGRRNAALQLQNDLAEALGYAYEDFLRLGRSLLSVDIQKETGIIPLAGNELPNDVELNKRTPSAQGNAIQEETNPYLPLTIERAIKEDKAILRLLEKTAAVLSSATSHAGALRADIESFYEAIIDKQDKSSLEDQVSRIGEQMKEMQAKLKALEEEEKKEGNG